MDEWNPEEMNREQEMTQDQGSETFIVPANMIGTVTRTEEAQADMGKEQE